MLEKAINVEMVAMMRYCVQKGIRQFSHHV